MTAVTSGGMWTFQTLSSERNLSLSVGKPFPVYMGIIVAIFETHSELDTS